MHLRHRRKHLRRRHLPPPLNVKLWSDFDFLTPLAGIEKVEHIGEAEDIVGHELPPLTTSAIVGYVDVYGFTEYSTSEWAGFGPGTEWKWLLRNAKLFKQPIPAKGRLGLYDVKLDPDNLPETK